MKVKAYLIKVVAAVVSVISLSAMPVYAADQKPVLKIEDAIKAAITYSTQISINSNQYDALKEQIKLNDSATYHEYQSIYLQKAQNEQQKQMIEDQIANDITNKYNTIIILQKEIQLINKNIEISTKELKQMEIKNKKGLVNPISYQSKEIDVINLKSSKTSKEEELKNAQAYFKIITGKDITQYSLDENIKYESFRIKGLVEGYASSKVDTYLKYDKELAKLKEDNLLTDGDAPIFLATYLTKKSAAEAETLTLEDKQKNLKQSLITNYSSLISLEEKINSLQLQFDILDKKTKSAALRYKAGMINVIEYDKQVVIKQELELEKLRSINTYNSLKESIQKPWVSNLSSMN
ncbi:MAG: putative multidrug efflux pump, outer membrane protein [Clostridia bacterium]|jgi:hypothetical protein|nr:putative multidrug efflux pump, outer membrane protein [Clostridia bacterium]